MKGRNYIIVLLMTVAHVGSAQADPCEDRFKALLIDGNGDDPVKIHSTQEIVGGMTSKNYFYMQSQGHWMTEMIEPTGLQWTLTYNNKLYSSADQGKSWTKIRDVDSEKNAQLNKENMRKNAETVRNAACGQEDLDGVMHDTVAADYSATAGFKSESYHKYWVDPDSGFIRKAFYHMKADNFENKTTQLLEKVTDLDLPRPE